MPTISTSGITGTDGIVPVYNPDARWCWWEKSEIYIGTQGANRFVPKIGDYVIDKDTAEFFEVTAIDPATLISTLQTKTLQNGGSLSAQDILFGVGPGTQADTYRVYVDKSVTPYILAVDQRLFVGGSMASFAKIFKGSDLSSSGHVISRLYDQSGTLLTDNVPLELLNINNTTNYAMRGVGVCYTQENLLDGEIVTIVIYSATGNVVSKRQLLVENTSFIRSVNASQKYIASIGLECPFFSSIVPDLIQFPVNVPVEGMGLIGLVNYSDGTTVRIPVDGNKFKMFGLDQYIGTIVGQRMRLVLSYDLSPEETVYGAVTGDGKHMTKVYNLNTLAANGAYSVKLFGYPVWVNNTDGYVMKWFLYTLDRNAFYEVTSHVTFNLNTGSFNPKAYGILQNLSVSINLRDINGSFNSYVFVQAIAITLAAPGDARTTNWTIGFEPLQSPPYGIDLHARAQRVNSNSWHFKVDSDIATQEEWLNRVYYATKPLFNSQVELTPPTPNFFAVNVGGVRTEFPLSEWNQELTIGNGPIINDTAFIEFFLRTVNGDVRLASAGIPIYEYA